MQIFKPSVLVQPGLTISEVELQTELDIARPPVAIQTAKVAVGSIPGKSIDAKARIEAIKAYMVEEIKHLRTELNSVALFKSPVLGNGEINVLDTRLSNEAALQVTELPESR